MKTEDRKRQAGITFEPGPAVPGLEHKSSAIEKYSSFNLFDQSRTTEKKQAAEPQAGSAVWHPAESKLESSLTLAETYAQARAMSFEDGTTSTESDINIQSQSDRLDLDIVEQVKKQLEDLINTVIPLVTSF